jgi:hypothetical protein
MAIKRVVFLCNSPFTKRDYERLGWEILKKNGLDPWYYDFSPIVYPKLYNKCTFPDLYQPQNYLHFLNEREGLKSIAELSPDSLVIMILSFGPKTFKFFQALSKTKIPYCTLANGSFPVCEGEKISRILSFIKKIFLLRIDTFKKAIYRPQFTHLLGIRRPDFCMVAGELSLENYKAIHGIEGNTEILWTHALDYNIYLENSEKDFKTTSNHAVFIDPLEPMFQGDSLAMGYKVPTSVENYYPSICNFFNHIEKQLDTKIKIAAHPKSNHPPYPNYFGRRETLRGETFGMIKNARFVIAHASNAIQFAILLRKPVLFLTTREFENNKMFSGDIKAYAHSVGKEPINLDEPLTIDWEKELQVDEKKYDYYINRYIKKRGTEEINSWQILTNRLKHQ